MSSLVTLDRLAAQTPDGRPLFENLTLTFGAERTGLVGRNGVGKTTLLQIIAGERAPSAGAVALQGRIGLLRQTVQAPPGARVEDLLALGEPLARLRRIAKGQGTGEDLDAADWGLQSRLGAALAHVGLPDLDLDRPAASLSGGQVTRVTLAGLLALAPNLLILDEPTNNLDAEARGLVAEVIERWPGGAIVVSHDRDVLRRMDRIVELSGLGARVYGGNYDLYLERKATEEAAAARELADAERLQVRVARETQLAAERKARRDAAGRRHSAKGTEPKIFLGAQAERAEVSGAREGRVAQRLRAAAAGDLAAAQAKVERLRKLGIELPRSGLAAGKTVLAIEDVTFAYPGGSPILRDVSLKVVGPERVAVSGPNGAGKTTLIRLAAGELAPTVGRVVRSAPTAFLDQQTTMLRSHETLVAAFRRLNPAASENHARAALARFLFRNVAAEKCVGALSGGERLRAALACVLMAEQPPQLLILDEPTNHLDLDSIGAVEAALGGYDGALLVVSHDRDFLAAIGVERDVALA
ncbi:ABC-F family ATP-binding cassette domain-containing protein [Phenylobacterium sp.]|jgi:ATPase subunit of ABC transporter with duplicated ATPase domains|uniref:ABC-F family ATP-binding cassette domain-containing protein n=1 Tax=Phenylobacterium sp. TaxID=1871053 RepID=UPI002E361A23|nr:ABC-F family ATP-binding cassette domain-containing protein [Phenylobacterium sp.]HEX4711951.1 ABC-F family ATP-binding cassette domain-containing protein [Phenylobacterium sp.]